MSRRGLFERILSPAYLAVSPAQCLKLRHKKSGCCLCLENCPLGAISFDGALQIDHSLCSGCGICANLCPTGVFELKDFPYESLLVPVMENSLVEFSCSSSPQENGDLRVPCLGYLDAAVLVGAIVRGSQEVRLNITHCEECRFPLGLQVINKSLKQANRILDLFGLPRKILVSAKAPSGGYNPGEGELYSRRGFFSYLGGKTRSRAAAAMEAVDNDQAAVAKTMVTLNPRLPEKRSRLLEHIKKLGQPVVDHVEVDNLPFAQVEISNSCDGCGMCVTFCPSGALRSYGKEKRQVTDFSLGDCLACGLCSEVCPQGAITYPVWINPSDLVTGSRKILAEHRKLACAQCGQTYVTVSGSNLCLNCKRKKEMRKWLVRMYQPS